MDKATRAMLNQTEQALLREVEPKRLDRLDEDGLADLHDRIRRARNKYSKLYRRRAAAQVESHGTRAKAHDTHARTVVKAEAFEEALATVSQRLARAAKASAAELKRERLAAAKARGSGAPAGSSRRAPAKKAAARAARTTTKRKAQAKKPTRTPASKRSSASARSRTRRTEARRGRR